MNDAITIKELVEARDALHYKSQQAIRKANEIDLVLDELGELSMKPLAEVSTELPRNIEKYILNRRKSADRED